MNEKETIEALMAPYRYNEIGSAVCAPETKICDAALATTPTPKHTGGQNER